ncbi:hypothetical protein [Mucilaginibacter sp.]|uniref:hypothetical protein n=1 Tax=Mucilaginibacter sp. TaxID=1882438 RepID=UPI0028475897|nr:hypothetical protein [Mucilaginibacter sp.]MDR3697962.1 hypothetical protein [Mucilaginibacter sp.]
MRRAILFLFIICSLSISCSTSKKALHSNSASFSTSESDGSSFDKAIVIQETHETPGIDAEYAWIRNKYPGSQTNSQALVYHNKRPFDIIHIITSDNAKVDVYFDISNFYGKF